jgi:uncharacterized protein YcbX
MTSKTTATVTSLWRYPVKSMMGESIESSLFTEKGLLADRSFALIDSETGKVVSAKNPKRWPNMFSFQSRLLQSGDGNHVVEITLPDGSSVNSNDNQVNSVLSKALGRDVRLVSQVPQQPQLEEYWPDIEELDNRDIVTDEDMPAGTFFDLAIVHLLTTSTLDALQQHYPEGQFAAQRFRPNILVSSTESGFVENNWIGKTLTIGEVSLKVTGPCPRCVMTTLPQGDLPNDTKILRTAAQKNNAHVGIYADVIKAGTIHCNDQISITG